MKLWPALPLLVGAWCVATATYSFADTAKPASKPAQSVAPSASKSDDDDDGEMTLNVEKLYGIGKQLFDEYAPDEVKRDYEFPSHEQWDAFAARLQKALEGGSLEELAAFEPEVRRALAAFRMLPDYSDYVDWLTERLDLIETARAAVATQEKPSTPTPQPTPGPGETPPTPTPSAPALPYYEVWLQRLRGRPRPPRADELLPLLKVIFSAEGLPPELAWLAEVESSLNPTARSPAGARGLFQLMPATARSMGLSLMPLDERTHPGKNARAAARLLRKLYDRFDSWPLALAAYNAGEGKVAATLKKKEAKTFVDIAEALPVETRMYVPKVFATMTVRENVKPDAVAEPKAAALRRAPDQAPAKTVATD